MTLSIDAIQKQLTEWDKKWYSEGWQINTIHTMPCFELRYDILTDCFTDDIYLSCRDRIGQVMNIRTRNNEIIEVYPYCKFIEYGKRSYINRCRYLSKEQLHFLDTENFRTYCSVSFDLTTFLGCQSRFYGVSKANQLLDQYDYEIIRFNMDNRIDRIYGYKKGNEGPYDILKEYQPFYHIVYFDNHNPIAMLLGFVPYWTTYNKTLQLIKEKGN